MLTMPCIENWDHVFDMIISFFFGKTDITCKIHSKHTLDQKLCIDPKTGVFHVSE